MPRARTKSAPTPKPTPKAEKFDFKIQKNASHIKIEDLEDWIKAEIKGKWSKRAQKNAIVYTFTTTDDAFKFKFRWTFS